MRYLRILLQLVILSAGGVAFAALISRPEPDLTAMVGLLGFVALLLVLTQALKEYTENRLVIGRKLSFKPMGIFLLLLGTFGIFYGVSFLIDNKPLPNGNGTCRIVCGLILLASQLFGEKIARVIAFSLWSGIGLSLCFVGYKIKGVKST